MARAADQFRQSDVTFWGIVALVAGAVALLSANVSALLPGGFFAGLHQSRLADSNAADLRAQLAAVVDARAELAGLSVAEQRLEGSTAALGRRFDGLIDETGTVRARVDALEGALPRLIRALPPSPAVDPTVITGSIGPQTPKVRDATHADPEGGAVRAKRSPAAATPQAAASVPDQPMPALLAPSAPEAASPAARSGAAPASARAAAAATTPAPTAATAPVRRTAGGSLGVASSGDGGDGAPVPLAPPRSGPVPAAGAGAIASAAPAPAAPADVRSIGIAVGAPVQPAGALKAWEGLAAKIGVMLVGMSPLLADDPAGSGGKVLVAGPIASIEVATTLCADIDRAGITCTPMPYVGTELAAATAAPAR